MQAETQQAPRRIQWPWQVAFAEWKSVARCVWTQIDHDHVFLVAAALAFYAVLALFPGLLAIVSLYGLLADRGDVASFISSLSSILPSTAWETLEGQLHALISADGGSLSIGFAVSTIGALWSASSGVDALIEAVNLAYDKPEKRSYFRRKGIALGLTAGLVTFLITAIALLAVLPSILALFGDFSGGLLRLANIARWPVLGACVTFGLLTVYRVAPCRKRPRRWALSGALIATVLWIAISSLFSLYVSEFGSYNQTYGAIGGVIVLLLWFYWSAVLLLLGAEITAALENEKPDCAAPAAS